MKKAAANHHNGFESMGLQHGHLACVQDEVTQ